MNTEIHPTGWYPPRKRELMLEKDTLSVDLVVPTAHARFAQRSGRVSEQAHKARALRRKIEANGSISSPEAVPTRIGDAPCSRRKAFDHRADRILTTGTTAGARLFAKARCLAAGYSRRVNFDRSAGQKLTRSNFARTFLGAA